MANRVWPWWKKPVLQNKILISVFKEAFKDTDYVISDHPTDLKHLYENVELPAKTIAAIFNPDLATMKNAQKRGWGVSPDFSITNKKREKFYLVK